MARDRSLWVSQGAPDGHAWATYRDQGQAPGDRPAYPTMSDATRAEVTKASRKRSTGVVPELTALIAECYILHGRLASVFGTIKDSADLSGMEAMTLYAIVNSDKPVTVPQIGRSLGHARQVIQRAARELEERGLVETRDNPGHKRAAFLVPTEPGRALKLGFDLAGQEVAKTLASGMDLETIRTTHAGLQKLRKNVEAREREQRHGAAGDAKK